MNSDVLSNPTVELPAPLSRAGAFRYWLKLGVIPVIAGSAAAGLALQLAGAALRVNT